VRNANSGNPLGAALEALAGHLKFEIEEGTRSADLPPETLAALKRHAGRAKTAAARPPRALPPGEVTSARRPSAQAAAQGDTESEVRSSGEARLMRAPKTASGASSLVLAQIAAEAAVCKACLLHKGRTKSVPGQGNPQPEILFVGEGPGYDEDQQGLAFVGAAGQLLTKMIAAMGFTREEVFIANVVKCRPPGNRQPLPEEMTACLPFLKRQIAALKPRVIVALGATAVQGLIGETGITRLRGRWRQYEGTDLMPTFHPSYLLRTPSAKREAWEDLKAVLDRLGRPVPPMKSGVRA
jgi:DNA polymerase